MLKVTFKGDDLSGSDDNDDAMSQEECVYARCRLMNLQLVGPGVE